MASHTSTTPAVRSKSVVAGYLTPDPSSLQLQAERRPSASLALPVSRVQRLSLPPILNDASPSSASSNRSLASASASALAAAAAAAAATPMSPATRRKALRLYMGIVAQFFLAMACLLSMAAAAFTLFSFHLHTNVQVGLFGVLLLVMFAFGAVATQLLAAGLGVGVFAAKLETINKLHLLIAYFVLDLLLVLIDCGLLFAGGAGLLTALQNGTDAVDQDANRAYVTLAVMLAFNVLATFVHVVISTLLAVLLCWSPDLFQVVQVPCLLLENAKTSAAMSQSKS